MLACTLGLQCDVSLDGHGLETTNKIVAISSGECGDASPTVDTQTWGEENPLEEGGVAEDKASAAFTLGLPVLGTPGDHYKLCRYLPPPVDIWVREC